MYTPTTLQKLNNIHMNIFVATNIANYTEIALLVYNHDHNNNIYSITCSKC